MMKKRIMVLIALVLMLVVADNALAVNVQNNATSLVQDVQMHGEEVGDGISRLLVKYGSKAITFELTESATVNVTMSGFIGGYGGGIDAVLYILTEDGKTLPAGKHTINMTNIPYFDNMNEVNGVWTGKQLVYDPFAVGELSPADDVIIENVTIDVIPFNEDLADNPIDSPVVNNPVDNPIDEKVFVPMHVSDIPNLPNVPTFPAFSNLREEDGHLVVDVDGIEAIYSYENFNFDKMNCTADSYDFSQNISFTYDADTSTFVSETMPSVSFDSLSFNLYYWSPEHGANVFADFDNNFQVIRSGFCDIGNGEKEYRDFTWVNGQLRKWEWDSHYMAGNCIRVEFDENENITEYWYENDDRFDVHYSADGTLLSCPVKANGTYFRYVYDPISNTEEWFHIDNMEAPIPAPEGYDLAKLTEMYPPLTIGRPEPTPTPNRYNWYPHNTLGLIGLPLRDLYPDLTDKWYNVVPVDLTRQGTQTFPLAASNLYYMGSACVEVSGDSVTVTYETPSGQWKPYLKVEDETLAWFTSAADITADFLNNPAGETKFGEAVSIAGDLKGQDVALLFICNHVTYRQPFFGETGYLTRYWPNLSRWKEYRRNLQALMTYLPE